MTSINTRNESSLHKSLKSAYAAEFALKFGEPFAQEVEIDGFVCDVAGCGQIVEVQTGGAAPLAKKISSLLGKYEVTLALPVVSSKRIIWRNDEGEVVKLSHGRGEKIFSIFPKITALKDLIFKGGLCIEAVEVQIDEIRLVLPQKSQLENGSRRHLKDWMKIDKSLRRIDDRAVFKSREDFLRLLPPSPFSREQMPKMKSRELGCMLWLYRRLGLVEDCGKDGRRTLMRSVANASGSVGASPF